MNTVGASVLVTGASGFIGRQLVTQLLLRGYTVRAVVRAGRLIPQPPGPQLEVHTISDLVSAPWGELLTGMSAVVHAAALAHRAEPGSAAEERRTRAVNVEAVGDLAACAAAAGTRRLVLLSSIGVLGAASGAQPFGPASPSAPHNFYARTKLEAERAASQACAGSTTTLCIVRPPLVYGPQAPGNFARFAGWVRRGVPLPLGAIHNRRSLVSVWNLCDLIIACLERPRAAEAPVLVADDEAPSTAELARLCAEAMGVRARLVAVPPGLLRALLGALGRGADYERLCGTLLVDTAESCARLNWRPPLPLRGGLVRTFSPAGGP